MLKQALYAAAGAGVVYLMRSKHARDKVRHTAQSMMEKMK